MFNHLYIGSAALKHFGIGLPRTKPSDTDMIATQAFYDGYIGSLTDVVRADKTRRGYAIHREKKMPTEIEIARPGSSAYRLLELADEAGLGDDSHFATPGTVLALKLSHRYLRNSPHFLKTMNDIIALRKLGHEVPSELEGEWMKLRQKETYYYAHPSLAQSKANFFKDDNIPYQYDHDTLHEAVKTFSRPAFEYIKSDKAEVYCSKDKFLEANEAIKLATVLEESYVLALERHQIPNQFRPEPRKSFEIALMKVCTSIASGWWRQYAWEHYHEVLSLYGDHYVDRFHRALADHVIKPFQVEKHIEA